MNEHAHTMDKREQVSRAAARLTLTRNERGTVTGCTFRAPLNLERSSGLERIAAECGHEMELIPAGRPELIEWQAVDTGAEIGLEYDERGVVVGYDGVMTFPVEAAALLEAAGIAYDPEIL